MEKAKYPPEEIDRMIDEEIARIDAANSAALDAQQRSRSAAPCRSERMLGRLLDRFKRLK